MLVVVAPDTEIFPVASVRRVKVMIAVLVVDGEKVEVGEVEFPAALGADPSMELEGPLTIVVGRRLFRFHPADHFVQFLLALARRRPMSMWPEGPGHLFLFSLPIRRNHRFARHLGLAQAAAGGGNAVQLSDRLGDGPVHVTAALGLVMAFR